MPPRPGKYQDTDDDMQDHSPVLLQGRGGNGSYVDVQQPPKFKNSHTQKAPEGKCLIPESVWDDEETWAPDSFVTSTPPSKASHSLLPAVSPTSSVSSQSSSKKVTQRNLDDELKGTRNQSQDAPGEALSRRRTRPRLCQKDYDFVANSLLQAFLAQESSIAAVLKEPGHKKTKRQVLEDVMCAWKKSADKRINSQSFARVNHWCNNLIKAAEHMVKDGLLERNVMLTENGNNTSMDDKPSEYEASLLQLPSVLKKIRKGRKPRGSRQPGTRSTRRRG